MNVEVMMQVMRNKYNSTTRDELRKTMVGGGILERKVIAAKNGTENRHEESRGERVAVHHGGGECGDDP